MLHPSHHTFSLCRLFIIQRTMNWWGTALRREYKWAYCAGSWTTHGARCHLFETALISPHWFFEWMFCCSTKADNDVWGVWVKNKRGIWFTRFLERYASNLLHVVKPIAGQNFHNYIVTVEIALRNKYSTACQLLDWISNNIRGHAWYWNEGDWWLTWHFSTTESYSLKQVYPACYVTFVCVIQ